MTDSQPQAIFLESNGFALFFDHIDHFSLFDRKEKVNLSLRILSLDIKATDNHRIIVLTLLHGADQDIFC